MSRAAERSDRINLRLSPHAKRTIERAAAYADKTLTDFVTEAALGQAETVVRDHESIVVSAEAWETFSRLLVDPPPARKSLDDAIAEHARVVRK